MNTDKSANALAYLIVMNDSFCKCFVQHFAVPLLESFRLGNLLIRRVTVEDVVIAFTRWAGPDMTSHITVGGKIKLILCTNMNTNTE